MTFRIEDKILSNNLNNYLIKDFLSKNNATKIHDDRLISSLYFDNKFFQMFTDSQEGCVPRKKIRLRKYSNSDQINFEIKTSSVEGRYKTTKIINNKEYQKYIKQGIFDNLYGLCFPVINIKYQRKYMKVFSQRTTIDSNIEYQNYVSKKIIKDNFNQIIEIKTSINEDLNKLNSNFPFRRSRFSKYSEAIKILKINTSLF